MEGETEGQAGNAASSDESDATTPIEGDCHPTDAENQPHDNLQQQQSQRQQLEEEEHAARLLALRNLTPDEYLYQTGVSTAMEEALGRVAGLRPCNPLQLFSDIMRDHARNTHPAARQAKLLRHARPTVEAHVRLRTAERSGGRVASAGLSHPADPDTETSAVQPSRHNSSLGESGTGSDPSNTADGITSSTTATAAAAAATGDLERTPGWAEAAPTSPHRQQHRQAEAMPRCTPRARGRHTSQLEVLCEPIHRFLCGGSAESGGGDLNSTEGAGATGLTKRTRLRAGRGCGGGGKGVRMRGGVCGNGGRAHWREVRRFLEALCRGAGVDAECTAAAMAALEREGGVATSAGEGGGRAGGGRWTPDLGVDFRGFVAAVRAVLLFEGFDRGARKAFVRLAGSTDNAASLDDLLALLYPSDSGNDTSRDGEGVGGVREAIRQRLDVGKRGETKVRLSTLADCVLSSSYGIV